MDKSHFVSVTDVLGTVTKAVKAGSTFTGKTRLIRGTIITIDHTKNGRTQADTEEPIPTYVVQLQGEGEKEPQLCFCDVERAFGITDESIGVVVQAEVIINKAQKDFTKVKKGDTVVFIRSMKVLPQTEDKALARKQFILDCKEAGVPVALNM